MGETRVQVLGERVEVSISLASLHLWDVGNGRLYGLSLCLMDGNSPKTREAFLEHLDGVTDALLTRPAACECKEP